MPAGAQVRIGMLGSGFIGEFHAHGLRHAAGARVVAKPSRWDATPTKRPTGNRS